MSAYHHIEVHAITDGLDGLLRDLTDRVIPVHVDQAILFDEIRIEIWGDTGRLIAFPAQREFKERIDITGTQLISKELQNSVNNLSEAMISDLEFEKQIESLYENVFDALIEAGENYHLLNFCVYDEDGEKIGGRILL